MRESARSGPSSIARVVDSVHVTCLCVANDLGFDVLLTLSSRELTTSVVTVASSLEGEPTFRAHVP